MGCNPRSTISETCSQSHKKRQYSKANVPSFSVCILALRYFVDLMNLLFFNGRSMWLQMMNICAQEGMIRKLLVSLYLSHAHSHTRTHTHMQKSISLVACLTGINFLLSWYLLISSIHNWGTRFLIISFWISKFRGYLCTENFVRSLNYLIPCHNNLAFWHPGSKHSFCPSLVISSLLKQT